jgi:hypothetical protein
MVRNHERCVLCACRLTYNEDDVEKGLCWPCERRSCGWDKSEEEVYCH